MFHTHRSHSLSLDVTPIANVECYFIDGTITNHPYWGAGTKKNLRKIAYVTCLSVTGVKKKLLFFLKFSILIQITKTRTRG